MDLCKSIEKCPFQKYSIGLKTMICIWKYGKNCLYCEKEEVLKWQEELEKVEQCPQRQDSLVNQMIDLHCIANKFGLYDAADYVRKVINKK